MTEFPAHSAYTAPMGGIGLEYGTRYGEGIIRANFHAGGLEECEPYRARGIEYCKKATFGILD